MKRATLLMAYLIAMFTLLSSSSCSDFKFYHTPGRTTGKIFCGPPKIVSRERLVQDRLKEDIWLNKELENMPTDDKFGHQGTVDIRYLSALIQGHKIQADPTATSIYLAEQAMALQNLRQQSEISDLEFQIKRKNLADQLKDGGTTEGQQANTNSTTPKNSLTLPDYSALQQENFADIFTKLPGKSDIEDASGGVRASPLDLANDKDDWRKEIRNKIIDNSLDDIHDLEGTTLYHFKMDATILPENNTSAWAQIEVKVLNPTKNSDNELKNKYDKWLDDLQVELNKALISYLSASPSIKEIGNLPDSFLDDMIYCINKDGLQENNSPIEAPGYGYRAFTSTISMPGDEVSAKNKVARIQKEIQNKKQYLAVVAKAVVYGYAEYYSLSKYATFAIQTSKSDESKWIEVKKNICGIEKFKEIFNSNKNMNGRVSVYAVTPKETVQRISEFASRRAANEFLMALSFMTGNIGGESLVRYLNVGQGLFHGIRRQPLVVGYTDINIDNNSKELAKFGWIIGPRFTITDNGKKAQYRHVTVQNGLSALLVLPVEWQDVELEMKTSWIAENGTIMDSTLSRPTTVLLPSYPGAITATLMDRYLREPKVLSSSIQKDNTIFTINSPASIWVYGRDVWRNPKVTIGAQISNKETVLPGMKAIVAEFKNIDDPGIPADKKEKSVPVYIWTGDGQEYIGDVKIVKPKSNSSGQSPKKPSTGKTDTKPATPPKLEIVGNPETILLDIVYKLQIPKGLLPKNTCGYSIQVATKPNDWVEAKITEKDEQHDTIGFKVLEDSKLTGGKPLRLVLKVTEKRANGDWTQEFLVQNNPTLCCKTPNTL